MNIRTCPAVTASGLVPGAADQTAYSREEAKDARRTHEGRKVRLLEEKERYRRVKTLGGSAAGMPEGAQTVRVCGREGDMAD